MKVLILLSIMLAASCWADLNHNEFAETLKSAFLRAVEECPSKTGATVAEIKSLKVYEIPETQSGKCFLACYLNELKILKDDATLDKDVCNDLIAQIKKVNADFGAKIQETADVCIAETKQGGDPCQVAYEAAICYQRERRSRGIPNIPLE